jgi:HK97 family phage portal protein
MGLLSKISQMLGKKTAPEVYGPGSLPLYGQGSIRWFSPGSQIDYAAKAGKVYDNSTVASGIRFKSNLFAEAPLTVETLKNGQWEKLDGHELISLIESPNPWYDSSVLWMGTCLSWDIDGNAYWLKLKTNSGRVGGFMYIPHTQIEPRSNDKTKLVTHYQYTPLGSSKALDLKLEDVVHFRFGIDPEYPSKGMSAMKAALREVATDNEANNYAAALLGNMGVPGVVLSPKADKVEDTPDPNKRQELKERWRRETTGDARGNVVMMPFPCDIHQLTMSPEDLALDKLRTVPVERICSALGLDPMVLGLSSPNKTYSNYKEALEAAVRLTIMPSKSIMAKQLTMQCLAPDFGAKGMRCGWDYSDVWVLQDDTNELWKTASQAYIAGVVTRADARALIGLESKPGDDVYYTDLTLGYDAAAQKTKADMQKAIRDYRNAFEIEQAGYADTD